MLLQLIREPNKERRYTFTVEDYFSELKKIFEEIYPDHIIYQQKTKNFDKSSVFVRLKSNI